MIVRDGELRRGYDVPGTRKLLWGTTDPNGDRTSRVGRGDGRQAFTSGQIDVIRFTCDAEAFRDDWRTAVVEHSIDQGVAELERRAHQQGQSTDVWRWRLEALSLDHCLPEIKSYRDNRWRPLASGSVFNTTVDGFTCLRLGDVVHCTRLYAEGGNYAAMNVEYLVYEYAHFLEYLAEPPLQRSGVARVPGLAGTDR